MSQVRVLTRANVRELSVVQPGLEVIDWVLYDTLNVAAGGAATSFTFFQQAVGQAGITLETTNMEIPGQLPSGYQFVGQKIIMEPLPAGLITLPATMVDAYNVTHAGRSQFFIGNRPYLQLPIKNLIGGAFTGFTGVAVGYAQSRTIVNGEMEYSPVIPANYSFKVQNDYDAAPVLTAAVKVRCQIIGKMIRPRQG